MSGKKKSLKIVFCSLSFFFILIEFVTHGVKKCKHEKWICSSMCVLKSSGWKQLSHVLMKQQFVPFLFFLKDCM